MAVRTFTRSTTALGMKGGGENDLFPGGIEANFVRVIWQQMLKAVNAMHEQRVRILRGVERAVVSF